MRRSFKIFGLLLQQLLGFLLGLSPVAIIDDIVDTILDLFLWMEHLEQLPRGLAELSDMCLVGCSLVRVCDLLKVNVSFVRIWMVHVIVVD